MFLGLSLAHAHPGGHQRVEEIERGMLHGDCPGDGLVERGRVHFQMEQYESALVDFAAARACSDATLADREESRVWMARGDAVRAESLLLLHLGRDPTDREAHGLLAGALSTQARWQEADASWSTALTGAATWSPDHLLAWADARELGYGTLEALRLVEAGLLQAPGSPAVQDRALHLEIAADRFPAALRRLDARIRAHPNQLDSWVIRGDVLLAMDEVAAARQAWSQAVKRYDELPSRLQNPRTTPTRDAATLRLIGSE